MGSALVDSAPAGLRVRALSSRELDIRDAATAHAALDAWHPDVVINAAAYTAVEQAEDDAELAMAVNGHGAGHLAVACANAGCPLIHLSTDYVFDGRNPRPYRENDATNPLNLYGLSKLVGEQQVRERLDEHLILRVSWVFSATGSNFVKTMLGVSHLDEVRVVNDQHGTPCGAASIATAIWQIVRHLAEAPRFGTYHFASTPPATWHEFAAAVYAAQREIEPLKRTPNVVAISTSERITRARRPMNSILNCTRLRNHYGIEPPDWRDALRPVVRELLVAAPNTNAEGG